MKFEITLGVASVLLSTALGPALAGPAATPVFVGSIGSSECRSVQLAAQAAVEAGQPYPNHGQLVSTAAHVVSAAEEGGDITAECASCIMNQFAHRIAVADQQPCGQLPGITSNLKGPETEYCEGPIAGSVNIVDLGAGGLQVTVTFNAGPP